MDFRIAAALAFVVFAGLYFLFRRLVFVGRCCWCKHTVWGWQSYRYALGALHGEKKLEHQYLRDCRY